MTKALAVLIVIAAFLAGCDKGPQDAGPVPTGRASHSSVTAGGEGTVSTGGVHVVRRRDGRRHPL